MSVAAVRTPTEFESRLARYLYERSEEGRAVRVGEKDTSEQTEIVKRYADLRGVLSQAARELEMSYRRAWQLLDSLNQSFGEPVILTSVGGKGGGGTTITPLGASLIDAYRELERDVTAQVIARFESLTGKVSHIRSGKRRSLAKGPGRAKSAAARSATKRR